MNKIHSKIGKFFSTFGWYGFILRRKTKALFHCLRKGMPAQSPEKPMLIHLGCGNIDGSGFINVDARPAPHVHYVSDVTDLSMFPSDCAALIYACHILEHIPKADLKKTLWEWRRVLKPGGTLRLSVPDFDQIINIYMASQRDIQSIHDPLMGGHDYAYNVHHSVFNRKYLARLLDELNFVRIREWDHKSVSYHDFEDWASKSYKWLGKEFNISLNLEADRG